MAPNTIPPFAHLVQSRSTSLRQRRRHAIVESLTEGPCRVDPLEHDRLRHEYWAESPQSSLLHDPTEARRRREIATAGDLDRWLAETDGSPRAVWSSPTYWSRITLVWVLAGIHRRGARVGKTWWVDATAEGNSLAVQYDVHHAVLKANDLSSAWAHRRTRIDGRLLEEAARAWAAYAAETPASIAAVLRAPKTPAITRARLRHYAAALPRLRDGVLHLSVIDRALFAELKRGARSIAHAVGQVLVSGVGSQRGDGVLFDRIASWTQTDPPAIELDGDGVRLSAMRGVLTPYGERLLSSGLAHPSEAPPFWVGGYLAYRDPIWSATEHKGLWMLEPWPRGRTA